MKKIAIGTDDFRKIREGHYLYVDKTQLIREVLDGGEVLLLPRPRRFGKTLNMTMLQAFFDQKQDSRPLFEGLAISRDGEAMTHLNGYPTIFLSLKSLKALSWAECCYGITELISKTLAHHYADLDLSKLSPSQREHFLAAYHQKAPVEHLKSSLKTLTELLYLSTGKKVILLIDEYDTPIHEGHAHGFYAEIINFMRGFLGEALKGNQALERAVVTGILRVGKESIYSGLNNLSVFTILDEPFSTCFGFSESEVAQLLAERHTPHPLSEVQSWYNGYRFGETTMYNPWSILKMLETPKAALTTYWIGTSGNELIEDLIKNRSALKAQELETLLRGQLLSCFIQESVAMVDIDAQSVWSLLLFSGYLTPDHYDPKTKIARLRLPNLEVRSFFEATVTQWLGEQRGVFELLESLLALRLKDFATHLAESIKSILSYHDVGPKTDEKTYHVLMVGLLASLSDRYEVLSNRESGHGRYDLALIPRQPQSQLPGLIFEFKQAEPKDLEAAAQAALTQISERDYAQTLRERGLAKIAWIGLAFSGKDVALASRVHEGANIEPSEKFHYSSRVKEPLPDPSLVEAGARGEIIGQIQLLKELKGEPLYPSEQLASFDQDLLETILRGLKATHGFGSK